MKGTDLARKIGEPLKNFHLPYIHAYGTSHQLYIDTLPVGPVILIYMCQDTQSLTLSFLKQLPLNMRDVYATILYSKRINNREIKETFNEENFVMHPWKTHDTSLLPHKS